MITVLPLIIMMQLLLEMAIMMATMTVTPRC